VEELELLKKKVSLHYQFSETTLKELVDELSLNVEPSSKKPKLCFSEEEAQDFYNLGLFGKAVLEALGILLYFCSHQL